MNLKESLANNATINKVVTKTWQAAPKIAFVAGAVGSVASLYLMWRAAKKHDDTIAEAIDILDEVHQMKEPDDDGAIASSAEYRKALAKAWIQVGFKVGKLYAPVATAEMVSLGLMSLGYGKLNARYVNTLATCTLLEHEYTKLRAQYADEIKHGLKQVNVEEFELDKDGNPKLDKNGAMKTKTVKEWVLDDGELEGYSIYAVPYDKEHSKYFNTDDGNEMATSWFNREFLIKAQDYFNMLLKYRATHVVFLNEVLTYLGYEPTQEGQVVGWCYDPKNPIGDNKIIFVPDELYDESYRARTIILDFNVDGNVWGHLQKTKRNVKG